MTYEFIKLFFFLFIILGVFYGGVYFLKKYTNKFTKGLNGLVKINVITSKMLMPKKYVSVIQVQDKYFILGITDHTINKIGELAKDEIDQPQARPEVSEEDKDFLSLLKKNLGMK